MCEKRFRVISKARISSYRKTWYGAFFRGRQIGMITSWTKVVAGIQIRQNTRAVECRKTMEMKYDVSAINSQEAELQSMNAVRLLSQVNSGLK